MNEEEAEQFESLRKLVEVLRMERDNYRLSFEKAAATLSGIHALLYPAPLKMDDGRTMVYRPKDVDPHEVLQELSDRIRAITFDTTPEQP